MMTNNQTLVEPLPCPFCGSCAINTTPPDPHCGYDAFIRCEDCEFGSGQQMSVEEATTAWNTRTHKEPPVSLEECALALYRAAYPNLSKNNEWTDQERNIYRDDARVVLDYIGREYE